MKPVCVLALLLVALSLVSVGFAQSATLSPVSVYEGALSSYNLTVNNMGGGFEITNVSLALSGFSDLSGSSYLGWTDSVLLTSLLWSNGSIATNALEMFGFDGRTSQVSGNTSLNITLTLSSMTNTTEISLSLVVVDDLTGPTLLSPNPYQGMLMRAGVGDYGVSITSVDLESGVANVSFSHAACGDNLTDYALDENTTNWSSLISFAQYNTSVTSCFRYAATNYAGVVSSYSGNITFDGTAPVVNLVSPLANASSGALTTFTFNATDDLASSLSCTVSVNGTTYSNVSATSGNLTSSTINLTGLGDGTFDWSIMCFDSVGLNHSASRSITLDTTAPTVTLHSPSVGSHLNTGVINYSVSDANGVATVVVSHPTNMSNWTEGVNTFVVNATDFAGNSVSASFDFVIDRTSPSVVLVSPLNDSSVDSNVNFTFTGTDLLSDNLSCTVSTSDNYSATGTIVSNTTGLLTGSFALGNFTWSVSCTDLAGNVGSSVSQLLHVVDMSGPSISSNFSAAQRTFENTLTASITDPSGVDTAYFVFENVSYNMSSAGSLFSGLFTIDINHSLGNYSLVIYANDTNGYSSSLPVNFELVPGYSLSLSANPTSVTGAQRIYYTLSVTNENSDNLSGTNVSISAYDHQVNGSLDVNNTYGNEFISSLSAGSYGITATYEADGFVYSTTTPYTVNAVSGSSSSGGGSSGGGSGSSSGSSGPSAGSGDGPTSSSDSSNTQSDNSNTESSSESDNSNTESSSDNSNVESSDESPQDAGEERQALGVGQAGGVFNLANLSILWWVLLALAGLILALFIASRFRKESEDLPKPQLEVEDTEDIDWNNYFERNN